MLRKIIHIDKQKCSGCGKCADACHEGAIEIIEGKARLVHEDYCDGLGDCLPACPEDAISFEERDAPAYDARAVEIAKIIKKTGCKGMQAKKFTSVGGELSQWPIQIKLMPTSAPYYNNSDLLIAADCTAYAYSRFHEEFIKGRVTIIGCPKLDAVDYTEKLSMILKENAIKSVLLTRMTVPCCGGLEFSIKKAIEMSDKNIQLKVVIISPEGTIQK